MNTYVQGQSVRLTVTFRNDAGGEADPQTVDLDILSPNQAAQHHVYDAEAVPPIIERVSEGVYRKVISVGVPGTWKVVWSGVALEATPTVVEFFSVRSA